MEGLVIDENYKDIPRVLSDKQKGKGVLIHVLQEMQKEHNYLPEEKLRELSDRLRIPLADVYSTATFYKHFYFEPRGKNIISVCTGTACYVRGASKVLVNLEEGLGVRRGETTEDFSVTLETVGCIGCCGLAPVVTVNEEVMGDVEPEKMERIIDRIKVDAKLSQT